MSRNIEDLQQDGTAYVRDGRQADLRQVSEWTEDLGRSDRFGALMSLALDEELSPKERAEFDRLLATDSEYVDLWGEWQAFDFAFRSTPSIEPPRHFVSSFEDRLIKHERRRRLWLGAGIGIVAVLLWSSLVLGLVGAGAYVMFNQSAWLISGVRVVAQVSATVLAQLSMIADVVMTSISTPQFQLMAVAYVVVGAMALWFWARFLRRSVGAGQTAAVRA